jgi:hypothetical protein
MSLGNDTFRYRYGDTAPVQIAFDQTTGSGAFPISIGDLCWIDSSDSYLVKGADAFAVQTNLADTQQAFAPVFAGVSAQRWDGSNLQAYGIKDGLLRIDTGGVFEMLCAAGSNFNAGDLVGPQLNTGNTYLLPQTVVGVSGKNEAIGRVARAVSDSAGTVLVEIFAAKFNLGYN